MTTDNLISRSAVGYW